MRRHSGGVLVCFLLSLLLLQTVSAKKDKPEVEETKFESIPTNLFYFEDSDVVLVTDTVAKTAYRSDDAGVKWKALDGVEKGTVFAVMPHPTQKKVAIVLGLDKKHWITKDRGETWKEFACPEPPTLARLPIAFHASDPDQIMFMTASCSGFECQESVYYTTDGFDTDPKLLRDDAVSCMYAKSTDIFTTGDEETDANKIFCVVKGSSSPFTTDYRLLATSDYFDSKGVEPALNDGRPVAGIMNIAAVKGYLVAAAKSEGTTELAMYVTKDAEIWHRAQFGEHKLEEDAYTLLESTNYSMQVDVMTTKPAAPMGVLLTSNHNGTFFRKNLEHTNRNMRGYVDFEKISNIQGILMANVVDNWEEVERSYLAEKKLKTQISFNDGRGMSWRPLKAGDKDLHLHSVTEQRNLGRIFSSPAPGIVMGVGNTGKFLGNWDEGDTYVSDDAGLTWRLALERPHLYEFGDKGGILVAIEYGETDEIKWSINHGKDWDTAKLEDLGIKASKIKPLALTTTPHSTNLKFILIASKGKGSNIEYFTYSFDFEGLHERACKKGDFERWFARVNDKGEPRCIMGHKQSFSRRKADADCFVNEEFKDAVPETEDCKCGRWDYECDFEHSFVWDRETRSCINTEPLSIPDGECKNEDDTYMGPSGYKLVPGNTCVLKGGKDLEEPVERECKSAGSTKPSGKITSEITDQFEGENFLEYYYLERSETNSGDDETVIMRTDERKVYITHDQGKTWQNIVKDDEVVAIYPHQYINDAVYLVTPSKKVYYSHNRGKDFHEFEAPEAPNQDRIQILSFHPTEKEWLIWTGSKGSGNDRQTIAHVSKKSGDDWETLLRSVRKCQFVYREDRSGSEELVYCEQYENEDPTSSISLISSDDFFEHKKELKRDVINFATMAEYIVVATRDDDQKSLKVDTSIDGQVFADAQFPSNFKVPHQQAYTVLDSSTHAVFLHVTVNNRPDQEYGSIVKSNSNGTSYVLSAGEVNRNGAGYVDFEKMQGLEGVAVINRVANIEEAEMGTAKKLKTYITHNDGADWALIKAPENAPEKGFECSGNIEKCSLHLHGYTERRDPRDTFSSASAIGLMVATGNVGEFLGPKKSADTFSTRDGGVTWDQIAEGNWMWEFGDQGSILVIVKEGVPVTDVRYSLDEGATWAPYSFTDRPMTINDITTVPSDSSRQFLLWGTRGGDLVTVNIDFSGLEERAERCKWDDDNVGSADSDYEVWKPRHPLSDDDCLFGHVAEYHRKKPSKDCFNGRNIEMQHTHNIERNCSCTRADFECDYNYERQPDGVCKLVPGLEPPNPQEACQQNPDLVEYYDVTGYRRIPLTTCQGGQELDYTSRTQPCPKHEKEFEDKHGISGAGLFFAIVLPIAAAVGIGYWVWKNWDGKFGRIRLGGGGGGGGDGSLSLGGHGAFDRDAPWIKFPIIVLSGIVAVVAALPMAIGSVWNAVSSRLGRRSGGGWNSRPFTSRNSFQRGRGDYAVVDPDEGELLGDDSDDEV